VTRFIVFQSYALMELSMGLLSNFYSCLTTDTSIAFFHYLVSSALTRFRGWCHGVSSEIWAASRSRRTYAFDDPFILTVGL